MGMLVCLFLLGFGLVPPLSLFPVIPLLVLLLLTSPAWLALPFLSKDRRETVLRLADLLLDWIKAVVGAASRGDLTAPTFGSCPVTSCRTVTDPMAQQPPGASGQA
jgi:hypothetical protein